ncbi:hypothetical protein ACFPN1_16240 [Lysobacter yangpyeongensis]|uniref:Uncharacterized protein n=1 Tax=Lysobacter yangpyeongensis TaxID=346182 RepID=A0ABW0SS44_9GAMM
MDDLFHTVRSLQTQFVVAHRTEEEIVLAVDAAEVAGVLGPANLRFSRPRDAWASRWDSVLREWQDVPELSTPMHGLICEAHIKPIPVGITVSFSDKQEPLIRWGFVADGLTVESGSGLSRAGA